MLWWKDISTIHRAGLRGNPLHTIWESDLVIQALGPKAVYCGSRVTIILPSLVSSRPLLSHTFLWKVYFLSWPEHLEFLF